MFSPLIFFYWNEGPLEIGGVADDAIPKRETNWQKFIQYERKKIKQLKKIVRKVRNKPLDEIVAVSNKVQLDWLQFDRENIAAQQIEVIKLKNELLSLNEMIQQIKAEKQSQEDELAILLLLI